MSAPADDGLDDLPVLVADHEFFISAGPRTNQLALDGAGALRAGETLYIQGLEVDPLTLQPQTDDAPVVVAVAVGGELKRLGTAKVGKVLDLQPLFEASASDGQMAKLHVVTPEPGCAVEVAGKAAEGLTPTSILIPAGKVLMLKVTCGDKPAWSKTVLAAPGQQVEVKADAAAPKQG